MAQAIVWPYVDPADASVAEDAKRRAAIAGELSAAADARAKAEAAERQAALAAEQEALAAAAKRREAARACQSALDAAAKSGVILFKSSSAVLEAKSTATLDRLAAAARSCGNLKVRIAGHTDATGAEDRNQKLSEDRARAVADYLAGKGVPAAGLESAGFGSSRPIATNDTAAGRAKNRRIEFTASAE
jgi:outer membrane protein OmpA-like peptidoglycan-associated protein